MATTTAKTRTCKKCGKTKKLTDFPTVKGKNGKTYHTGACKSCRYAAQRRWVADNLEHVQEQRRQYHIEHRDDILKRVKAWQEDNHEYKLAYQRAWYLANADRLIEKAAKWYRDNPDVVRDYRSRNKDRLSAKSKEWRAENPDKVLALNTQWRAANKERIKEYTAAYHKAHPELKRLSEGRRRAQKRGSSGKVSVDELMAMLKAQRGKCAYCKTPLNDTFDLDHVVPLSRGGTHELANVQILCPTCNRRKHAKTHDEFLAYLRKQKALAKVAAKRVRKSVSKE